MISLVIPKGRRLICLVRVMHMHDFVILIIRQISSFIFVSGLLMTDSVGHQSSSPSHPDDTYVRADMTCLCADIAFDAGREDPCDVVEISLAAPRSIRRDPIYLVPTYSVIRIVPSVERGPINMAPATIGPHHHMQSIGV